MHLVISIVIDGQTLSIEFGGGMSSPRRVNGSFSTTDPKIQAALERHGLYNKTFELVKVINQKPAPAPVPPPEPEPEPKEIQPAYVSKAKNAQQAKFELNKKFKVAWSNLKNVDAVLAMAEKFNIDYPEWERAT